MVGAPSAELELWGTSLPPLCSCVADGLRGAPAWRRAEHPEGGAVPAGGPGRPAEARGSGHIPGQEKQRPQRRAAVAQQHTPQSAGITAFVLELSKGPSSAQHPRGWGPGGPARAGAEGSCSTPVGDCLCPAKGHQAHPALSPWASCGFLGQVDMPEGQAQTVGGESA